MDRLKKIAKIVLIVVLIGIVGYASLTTYIKHILKNYLETKVKDGSLHYKALNISLLTGTLSADSLWFKTPNQNIYLKHIDIKGISYITYWVQKHIHFRELNIDNPKITILESTINEKRRGKDKIQIPPIKIAHVNIKNLNLNYFRDSNNIFRIKQYDLQINGLKYFTKGINQKSYFDYKSIAINGGPLFTNAGKLNNFQFDRIYTKGNTLIIEDIAYKPKYNKQSYLKVVNKEADLITSDIKKISLQNYKLYLINGRLGFNAQNVIIDNIHTNIYRDKRLPDDDSNKPLYSKMLREAPLDLNIDSLLIKNGEVYYSEVQEKTDQAGKVFFKSLNVNIANICNVHQDRQAFPETTIDAHCMFMDSAPLDVHWHFKVNDSLDHFQIKGETHNITPESVNLFILPALNAKVKGDNIKDLYFNFYGNYAEAKGGFKMNYKNLKLEILKENQKEKKGFLSFIGNIIVKHQNKSKEDNIELSNIERDSSKSFWNYFWRCISAGLQKTLLS